MVPVTIISTVVSCAREARVAPVVVTRHIVMCLRSARIHGARAAVRFGLACRIRGVAVCVGVEDGGEAALVLVVRSLRGVLRWILLIGLRGRAWTRWWWLWQRLQETVLEAQATRMLVVWRRGGSNGWNNGGGRSGRLRCRR